MARTLFVLVVSMLACSGCSDWFDVSLRPPPAPEGFPQPEDYEDAKAELEIDGERYVTENATGISYNEEGGFEDQLRGRLSLDSLRVEFRELEEGPVQIGSGDVTASWQVTHEADDACGSGRLEIIGMASYDSGLYDDRDYAWGTVQFELCPQTSFELGDREVTGRWTAAVDYR